MESIILSSFIPMMEGKTLAGWHAVPRLPVPRAPGDPAPDTSTEAYHRAAGTSGKWTLEDGAIAGRQVAEHPDPRVLRRPGCKAMDITSHSGVIC